MNELNVGDTVIISDTVGTIQAISHSEDFVFYYIEGEGLSDWYCSPIIKEPKEEIK